MQPVCPLPKFQAGTMVHPQKKKARSNLGQTEEQNQ
jgi:hypothetical protein